MSNPKYELNPNTVCYETAQFAVDVGPFPGEELDCYRIHNKDTHVIEYSHSILFYARQWADMATQILADESGSAPEQVINGEVALPGM